MGRGWSLAGAGAMQVDQAHLRTCRGSRSSPGVGAASVSRTRVDSTRPPLMTPSATLTSNKIRARARAPLTRNIGDEVRVRLVHLDLARLVFERDAANPDAAEREPDAGGTAIALLALRTARGGGGKGDVGAHERVVQREEVEQLEQV